MYIITLFLSCTERAYFSTKIRWNFKLIAFIFFFIFLKVILIKNETYGIIKALRNDVLYVG